jgi:hypothetical protein
MPDRVMCDTARTPTTPTASQPPDSAPCDTEAFAGRSSHPVARLNAS